MHNGYMNTCSFTKDGTKMTLAHLSLSNLKQIKPQNTSNKSNFLLTISEPLLKASQHEFKAFREWVFDGDPSIPFDLKNQIKLGKFILVI